MTNRAPFAGRSLAGKFRSTVKASHNRVGLGPARLSFIDLATGDQPIARTRFDVSQMDKREKES
jgi:hypothetical protein